MIQSMCAPSGTLSVCGCEQSIGLEDACFRKTRHKSSQLSVVWSCSDNLCIGCEGFWFDCDIQRHFMEDNNAKIIC